MKALAQWAMNGQRQATLAAAICLALPMLFWLGAALLALVILRQGFREGNSVVMWALLPAIAWLAAGDPTPLLTAVGASALAVLLRQSVRLDKTVMVSAILGIAVYFMLPLLWSGLVALVASNSDQFLLDALPQHPELHAQLKPLLVPMVSGVLAALHTLVFMLCLLLGRYWQSELFNVGGFGREFKQLRLPLAYCAFVVLMMLVVGQLPPDLAGIMPVLTVPMMIAAMALFHGLATNAQASPAWLVLFYIVLVMFGPYMYTLLIFVALVDSVFNFRARQKDTAAK